MDFRKLFKENFEILDINCYKRYCWLFFMSKVTDSIGEWFEGYLARRYRDLVYTGDEHKVPDYLHGNWYEDRDPEENFWIEAKVGNIQWGCRIKGYQVDAFHRPDKPSRSIVYALGFHDFDRAHKRLTQKTGWGRRRHLRNNANVVVLTFVTNNFMNLLYGGEVRVSAKDGVVYCMMKNSTVNNVFENRQFRRGGKKDEDGRLIRKGSIRTPETYYGFDYGDYRWFEGEGEDGLPVRAILHPTLDEKFADYLAERESLTEYEYT